MSRLLGILVVLAGCAAVPVDATEYWSSSGDRYRHHRGAPPQVLSCSPASQFCIGPNGLVPKPSQPFLGIPNYARPTIPGFGRPVQGRGPIICDPARGGCFRSQPPTFGTHRPAFGTHDYGPGHFRTPRPRQQGQLQFRPEHGVRCDRLAEICYDNDGPSRRLTSQYFDDQAGDRLKKKYRRPDFAEPVSRPARGVTCDSRQQACYGRGRPSVRLTEQYLGRDVSQRLEHVLGRN